MPLFVFKCMLLCVLMSGTVCACMLKNHTIWIERHDCAQCVAINTTICSGYCYTQSSLKQLSPPLQDTNLKGRFGRTFLIQRSCVPLSLVYQAVHFPGCPQNVNPQLYFPVALCCSCRRCDSRTHHCVRSSQIPHDRCTMALGSLKNENQPALET